MKKFFALTLAVAMVLSLASVSMAAVVIDPQPVDPTDIEAAASVYTELEYYSSKNKTLTGIDDNKNIPYGKTVYLVLTDGGNTKGDLVYEVESGAALKVQADWDEGAKYVESVEVVKKKVTTWKGDVGEWGVNDSIYMIAITTTGSETGTNEVSGTLKVTGRTGTGANRTRANFKVGVDMTMGYEPTTLGANDTTTNVTSKDEAVWDFEAVTDANAEEFTVNFGTEVEVIVNAKTEKKIIMAIDEDTIDDIDDAYPEANLDYYALTGKFRKTAEVYLFAEEGSYLYEVVDGELVAMDAEYDEWEGAFIFKTKTLGTYVVSDAKLDLGAAVETAPANPSTGAAA